MKSRLKQSQKEWLRTIKNKKSFTRMKNQERKNQKRLKKKKDKKIRKNCQKYKEKFEKQRQNRNPT
jgi:hypothetical protein